MALRYFLQLVSCLSFAIHAQAQDCSAPIGGANMDLKDTDIVLETFPDGGKVTFVCNVGFMSAGGSGVVTCAAGIWSPVRLICERKNCGSAGEVENGKIDYSGGTEFGDKIVISCDTGFRLVGIPQRTCGDKGWLGRLPVCEVVTCDPPDEVANATYGPDKEYYDYREVVQFSCQKDLTLSGSKTISCAEDGTFKPEPPTCIKVACAEPNIKNAEWVEGSRPPYGHKATLKYRCLTGYNLVGESTVICEIDSNWSPALPKCEMVTCHPPPVVANGTFSPNKESYQYGETVEYSCQKGFTLNGFKSVSCSEDGTFKIAHPTCTKVAIPTKPPTPPTTTTSSTTTTTTSPPAGNVGNSIGIALGVICGVALFCVALYFGGRKLKEKMKGSGNGHPDQKASKRDEEVALSDQKGLEQSPAEEHEAGVPPDSSTSMNKKDDIRKRDSHVGPALLEVKMTG